MSDPLNPLIEGRAPSGGALSCSVRIERGAPNGGGGDDKLSGVQGAAAFDRAEQGAFVGVANPNNLEKHVRGHRVTKIPSIIQIIFYK